MDAMKQGAAEEAAAGNKRGIILMVAAMAAFAVEDAFIKLAGLGGMPTEAILGWLGLGGAAIFGAYARWRGIRIWTRDLLHPAVIARNIGEVAGTYCFVKALTLIPLSLATTILQTMPLMVTAGAALLLGEQVGWRRWLAIAAGFCGVLLVMRPATGAFDPLSLWAVGTVAGLAARDIATRKVPKSIDTMQLMVWAYAGIALLGLGLIAGGADWGRDATPAAWGWVAAMLAIGAFSYWALTEATRIGEVSVVAPFRYSRLVFGLAIGVAVFGETLDGWMIAGALIIMASGLYAFHRERVRARG
jgi:drug/metabolite transporter (DMT)-like permease